MKVLLNVPMSVYSGYGNDGIGLARAFMALGADVYLKPTGVQAPLPADVAMLLTKTLGAPFDLIITHVDPGALKAHDDLRKATKMLVGWTMWEYSNFGNLPGRSKLKKNLYGFDALIGYDAVSSQCLREYYKGPVITQQGGYWADDWKPLARDWHEDEFRMCMIGVLSERKDPFVAVRAFARAQELDPEFKRLARLSLKTTTPGLHSKMEDVYPGLRVFYDIWPTEVVKEFYRANHVLLAPSRGEGKNMPALEFMSTGGTVVATDWAGHQQWLDDSYAYRLKYELAPVNDDFPGTLNARASDDHMVELMLHMFHNRDEVKRKGELAAEVIPKLSSWPAVTNRLMEKLRAVPHGEELWSKYILAQGGVPGADR